METTPSPPAPDASSLWDWLPFVVLRLLFRQYLTFPDKLALFRLPPPLSTFLDTRSAWLVDSHYRTFQCFARLLPPGWYRDARPTLLPPHRYLVSYDVDRVACHIACFFLTQSQVPPMRLPLVRLQGWHQAPPSEDSSLLTLLAAFRRLAVPAPDEEEETVYDYPGHGYFSVHRSRRQLRWVNGVLYTPRPSPPSQPQVYQQVPFPIPQTKIDTATCSTCAYFGSQDGGAWQSLPIDLRLDPRNQSLVVRHGGVNGRVLAREARARCLTPMVLQVEKKEGGMLRAKNQPMRGPVIDRTSKLWRGSEWVLSAADEKGSRTAIHYDCYLELDRCPLIGLFEAMDQEAFEEDRGEAWGYWCSLFRGNQTFVLKKPHPLKRQSTTPRSKCLEKKRKKD